MKKQVKLDMVGLIDGIRQQISSLEKKIDTLISQGPSQRVPTEARPFSQPFRRFDRPQRHGEGRQDNSYRERTFTKAICAACNKECEVPFRPTGGRPVYCKECFAKRKVGPSGSGFEERSPRPHFDKHHGDHTMRKFGEKKIASSRRRKGK